MSDIKTKVNDADVEAFLNAVPNERKRRDSFAILEMMKEVTGEEPKMWGPSIVGFGTYHYKYDSGREGDMPVVGFSPRKLTLTLNQTRLEKNRLAEKGSHFVSVAAQARHESPRCVTTCRRSCILTSGPLAGS